MIEYEKPEQVTRTQDLYKPPAEWHQCKSCNEAVKGRERRREHYMFDEERVSEKSILLHSWCKETKEWVGTTTRYTRPIPEKTSLGQKETQVEDKELNLPELEKPDCIDIMQKDGEYICNWHGATGRGETMAKALKDLAGSVKGRSVLEEIVHNLPPKKH